MPNTHVFLFTAQKYTHIDLFADTAAILISIVSNSYYGMPRGQIHINVPPEYHIMCFGTIEIKMAAVSAKRSIHYFLHHQQKLRTSAQAPHQQSLFPDKSTVPCFYTFFSYASSCCLNVIFPGTQRVLACFLRALMDVHCRDFNIFSSHGLLPSDLVAQSVERRRSNPKVVGSIPTLVRVFLCPCVGPFPSVGLTLTWFIWDRNLALHITLYSVNSYGWFANNLYA